MKYIILIPVAFFLGYWQANNNLKSKMDERVRDGANQAWMSSCARTIDRVCFHESCQNALEILEDKICKVPEEE